MKSMWSALESIPGLVAVPETWRRRLGAGHEAFMGAYLRQSARVARSFPCPDDCGCAHAVVRHASGRIVAVCRCESWNCNDIELQPEEAVLLELNGRKLGRNVARAFGCDTTEVHLGMAGTQQVATFGNAALPVVMTIQYERLDFAGVVAQLVATLKERFILLTPTSRFVDANSLGRLRSAHAAFFDLASHLTVLPGGGLHAPRRGGELFSPLLPEPEAATTRSEASRIFAVLCKLKHKRAGKKAALFDVFLLTVVEGHSQRFIARHCKCSPALITARVQELERAFELPIDTLKTYASDIAEMERTVKEERRKKGEGDLPDPYEWEPGDDETMHAEEPGLDPRYNS